MKQAQLWKLNAEMGSLARPRLGPQPSALGPQASPAGSKLHPLALSFSPPSGLPSRSRIHPRLLRVKAFSQGLGR